MRQFVQARLVVEKQTNRETHTHKYTYAHTQREEPCLTFIKISSLGVEACSEKRDHCTVMVRNYLEPCKGYRGGITTRYEMTPWTTVRMSVVRRNVKTEQPRTELPSIQLECD